MTNRHRRRDVMNEMKRKRKKLENIQIISMKTESQFIVTNPRRCGTVEVKI